MAGEAGKLVLVHANRGDDGSDEALRHVLGGVLGGSCDIAATHTWQIETKYYSAQAQISVLADVVAVKDFGAEALVVLFSSDKPNVLETLKVWEDSESWANILLLVDTKASDAASSAAREKLQEWAIQTGFEVISLHPDPSQEEDEDDGEKKGIERVCEALTSHQWPNLTLKDSKSQKQGLPADGAAFFKEAAKQESCSNDGCVNAEDLKACSRCHSVRYCSVECQKLHWKAGHKLVCVKKEETVVVGATTAGGDVPPGADPHEWGRFMRALAAMKKMPESGEGQGDEDDGQEDPFTTAVAIMQSLRERGKSLPDEQRRALAERVATTFAEHMMAGEGEDAAS